MAKKLTVISYARNGDGEYIELDSLPREEKIAYISEVNMKAIQAWAEFNGLEVVFNSADAKS